MSRIKVYIFTSSARGTAYGFGTYVDNLKKMLAKSGVIYAIVNIFSTSQEVTASRKDGCLLIDIPSVSCTGNKSLSRYSRNIAYLLKEFIQESADTKLIFHMNYMDDPLLAETLKILFPQCKIVLVCHYTKWSLDLMGDEEKLIKIVNKSSHRNLIERKIAQDFQRNIRMIKEADMFVCVAQHTRNTFEKVGKIDLSKSVVVSNALEDEYSEISREERSTLRNKYRIGVDEQVILYVGRLDQVKGIQYLLEAFNEVLKQKSNARLFLIGEGEYSQWLNLAGGNWSRISFTGMLDKNVVSDFYKMADVGVVCSLHEEFGYVAIEMMMNRLPIVVSDVGGLSEIVDDGINGLKVKLRRSGKKSGDTRIVPSKELSGKILSVLNDSALASLLGKNARKKFLENYEINQFKERMLDVYNSL